MRTKKKKKKNKKRLLFLSFFLLIIVVFGIFGFIYYDKIKEENNKRLENKIKEHYDLIVKTNKDAAVYLLDNNKYSVIGSISENEIISLSEVAITYETKYFKLNELGDYYIKYQDVEPTDDEKKVNDRFKNYIPYNQNIVTSDDVRYYDEENNVIYNIKRSEELPILIKYGDYYGVEYNDRLLKVHKDDVEDIVDSDNTKLINTNGIAVLNYHFFYDETQASERQDCNQVICHPKGLTEEHLKYITDNNIFTPTMEEFELYIDNKIQLPKSVLITIDDGWRMYIGIDLMEKYKVNATVFLITSWFKEIKYFEQYDYIEFHSHGDNLHEGGQCAGGQGGAIKCWSKDKLLADLALSRDKLRGSTVFCYPFYEYNNYSIEVLKEAGFTMAFADGWRKAKPGDNKFELPRYVIYNSTSVNTLKNYIG